MNFNLNQNFKNVHIYGILCRVWVKMNIRKCLHQGKHLLKLLLFLCSKNIKSQWNCLVGKGLWCKVWLPVFNHQNPYWRKREPTHVNCPMIFHRASLIHIKKCKPFEVPCTLLLFTVILLYKSHTTNPYIYLVIA